jgi:hypothetical protein
MNNRSLWSFRRTRAVERDGGLVFHIEVNCLGLVAGEKYFLLTCENCAMKNRLPVGGHSIERYGIFSGDDCLLFNCKIEAIHKLRANKLIFQLDHLMIFLFKNMIFCQAET